MASALDTIYKRLKEARETAGLSQEDVAKHLGIGRASISAIENGQRKLLAEELGQLSKLYVVSMEWLLYGYKSDDTEANVFGKLFAELPEERRKEIIRMMRTKTSAQKLTDAHYMDNPGPEMGRDYKGDYYIDVDGRKVYIDSDFFCEEPLTPEELQAREEDRAKKDARIIAAGKAYIGPELTDNDKYFMETRKYNLPNIIPNDAVGELVLNYQLFTFSINSIRIKHPPLFVDEVIGLIDKLQDADLSFIMKLHELILRAQKLNEPFSYTLYAYALGQYQYMMKDPENRKQDCYIDLWKLWSDSEHLFPDDLQPIKNNSNRQTQTYYNPELPPNSEIPF